MKECKLFAAIATPPLTYLGKDLKLTKKNKQKDLQPMMHFPISLQQERRCHE